MDGMTFLASKRTHYLCPIHFQDHIALATRRKEYKTNKATLLHFFMDNMQVDMPHLKGSLHIKDGRALFHAMINISRTFGEICLKMLVHEVAKKEFVFSADSYHADSIKAQEYTMYSNK